VKLRANTGLSLVVLAAGILAAAGCGAGGGTVSPPATAILTTYASGASFGDVAVGSTTTYGITFANTGQGPLTLQQNSVTGTGFSTSGIGQGVTLNPGQYVSLAVSFAPSATGPASGAVSLSSTASSSPINLPLSGNGVVATHSATITWNASPAPVVGYNVYRTPASNEAWTKLNSSPVIATTYSDWNVQAGTSYLYVITSVNPSDRESEFSNATLTTIPTP
jgi:Abnormal spindle-like microcephaly-assoc'd, ASPM-SPD-2-Hydin